MMDLRGRRYLVTGLLNHNSIAWDAARQLLENGGDVILTSTSRTMRVTKRYAAMLPRVPEVIELEARTESDYEAVADYVSTKWTALDGVLHSIAFAQDSVLNRSFLAPDPSAVLDGFLVSSVSLQLLVARLLPLLSKSQFGGSVVGLTIDTSRALPGYGWMGVYKAALRSIAEYLAIECGRHSVRVNLVAAGPLETASALGVNQIEAIKDYYRRAAPLGWDPRQTDAVTGALLFLLSDFSRNTTGHVLHCDGGAHAVVGEVGQFSTGEAYSE